METYKKINIFRYSKQGDRLPQELVEIIEDEIYYYDNRLEYISNIVSDIMINVDETDDLDECVWNNNSWTNSYYVDNNSLIHEALLTITDKKEAIFWLSMLKKIKLETSKNPSLLMLLLKWAFNNKDVAFDILKEMSTSKILNFWKNRSDTSLIIPYTLYYQIDVMSKYILAGQNNYNKETVKEYIKIIQEYIPILEYIKDHIDRGLYDSLFSYNGMLRSDETKFIFI